MSYEDEEESPDNECCVCGGEWLGLLGAGGQFDFYRCSKCGNNCCANHYDSSKGMCTNCAEEDDEEEG